MRCTGQTVPRPSFEKVAFMALDRNSSLSRHPDPTQPPANPRLHLVHFNRDIRLRYAKNFVMSCPSSCPDHNKKSGTFRESTCLSGFCNQVKRIIRAVLGNVKVVDKVLRVSIFIQSLIVLILSLGSARGDDDDVCSGRHGPHSRRATQNGRNPTYRQRNVRCHRGRSGHVLHNHLLVPFGPLCEKFGTSPLQLRTFPRHGPPACQGDHYQNTKLFLNISANSTIFQQQTVLKINAAFVFFLLITTFVVVNNVQAYDVWYADRATCVSGDFACLVNIPILRKMITGFLQLVCR